MFVADSGSNPLRYNQLLGGCPQWAAFGGIKMDNNNFQRKGVKSNTETGKIFEKIIYNFLEKNNVEVEVIKDGGINRKITA